MLRQHRAVARRGSLRLHRPRVLRLFLLVLTCAALATCGPPGVFAAREPGPAPEALWDAFPLNPTARRIGSPTGRAGTLRPPVQPVVVAQPDPQPASGASSTASGAEPFFLVAIVGGSLVGLLAVAALAAVALRYAAGHRRGATPAQEEPSAYISAVFVGSRRLPIIEGTTSHTRNAGRMRAGRALAGCVIAVVVAVLVFQYLG
jgi:hypothetical protein